jgi:hypothetical protein
MNTKNSKWILPTVLTAIVVILLLAISAAPASAQIDPEDKKEAIDLGLAWLAEEQDPATGAWNLDYYPVASTAFAVLKFEHHAKEILKIDPFDPDYEYSDNIVAGLKYIFEHAAFQDIDVQPAGDPDVNIVNGKGIYFTSGRTMYETGIVMMALEASCHPGFIVDAPGSPINGWTYLDVMKDTVDFVAWAQNEAGNGRGGWRYNPNDGSSDNSVSQWPVLGLMSAGWGIDAPDWVKTELEDHWLDYSQADDTGCFGYASSAGGNVVAMTASGLIQLTYCGVTTNDPRWVAGRRCICENWGNSNIGHFYAMYGVMKAAMTAQPEPIWDFCGHLWQPLYDEWLIDNQKDDGSWPAQYDGTGVLATEWALLILQKVVPPPPVISVYVDIKPGSCPNPLNKKSKGVLPVAVLGTEDFDVTAIDPETILLNRSCEGCEGVAPIRWSYEDVATPFEGELCDCHELEGDGILDLTLKFDTQELVEKLDLCPLDGQTIPLTITGNLKSDTPIEGEDCIWVLKPGKG